MRKVILLVSIIFLFSVFGFGQEIEKADWQTYRDKENLFLVQFPTKPSSSKIVDINSELQHCDLYKNYFDKTFFFIFSCKGKESIEYKVIQEIKFGAKLNNDSKLIEKKISDNSIQTNFFDLEGYYHTIREIEINKQIIILHTLSENIWNEHVTQFTNSFRIYSDKLESKSVDTEQFKDYFVKPQNTIKTVQPATIQSAIPKQPTQVIEQSSKIITTDLRLFNKPSPAYTTYARIYNISGIVRLRVTFQKDGTIGSVTAVYKLPFGLTTQAINVAKEVKFEPKTIDGIPQTVTKTIEYSFRIY